MIDILYIFISITLKSGSKFIIFKVEGAAKMLQEEKKSEKIQSVSFMYQSIREINFINQDLRMEPDFPELCKDVGSGSSNPTHVVTSVTKGLNAVLDFQKFTDDSTTEKILSGKLKAAISMGSLNISGSIQINMTENVTELTEDLQVVFYGDALLEKNPRTYQEAQEVINTLGTRATESETIIFYDMSPIDKYCDERTSILNKLSEEKIKRSLEIMKDLETMRAKINDLSARKSAKTYYHSIGKHMASFLTKFSKWEAMWKQNISLVLPKIKTNDMAESKFVRLIIEYDDSPWNLIAASFFMDNRRREMDTVDMIIEQKPKNVVIQETGNGNGNICLFQHKYLVQYTLHVLPGDDVVDNYIKVIQDPLLELDDYSESKEWFNDETMVAKAGYTHLYFKKFQERNAERKDICWLINLKQPEKQNDATTPAPIAPSRTQIGPDSCPPTLQQYNKTLWDKGQQVDLKELKKRHNLVSRIRVDVYRAGDLIACNMLPPPPMKIPEIVEVDFNTLFFNVPYGLQTAKEQNIGDLDKVKLRIEYSYEQNKTTKNGKHFTINNSTKNQMFALGKRKETRIQLKNLETGKQYFISVFVAYEFGDDLDSAAFSVNTTDCSTPKNFEGLNETAHSIDLKWDIPLECAADKNNNDSEPRITYKILYRKFDLSNAKSEDWAGSNTEITDKTSASIHGLESSQEYEFIIEAVLSKVSKNVAPPPPKIIHNNERSMVKKFTLPEYPKNLNVNISKESVLVADITWDRIKTNIDGFKIVYTVNVTNLDKEGCNNGKSTGIQLQTGSTTGSIAGSTTGIHGDRRSTNGDPQTRIQSGNQRSGGIVKHCGYEPAPPEAYQTSEPHMKIRHLLPDNLYKFAVNVRTPYGESPYSPPIIMKIRIPSNSTIEHIPEVEVDKNVKRTKKKPHVDYQAGHEDYAENQIKRQKTIPEMDYVEDIPEIEDMKNAKESAKQPNEDHRAGNNDQSENQILRQESISAKDVTEDIPEVEDMKYAKESTKQPNEADHAQNEDYGGIQIIQQESIPEEDVTEDVFEVDDMKNVEESTRKPNADYYAENDDYAEDEDVLTIGMTNCKVNICKCLCPRNCTLISML